MFKFITIILTIAFSTDLEYGPYIDILTDTTVGLRYSFKLPKQSWLSWGPHPKCEMYLTFFGPQKKVTANIYALQPDKEYCYRIYVDLDNSKNSYVAYSSIFKTFTKSTSTEFNFVAFTDINADIQQIIDMLNIAIDTKTALAILYSEIEEDNDHKYFLNYSSFISKIPFYLPLIKNNMDELTKKPKKNFLNLFRFSYGDKPPYYYYIDIANSRLIFIDLINSNFNKTFYLKQKEWLENTALVAEKEWFFLILNTKMNDEESVFLKKLRKPNIDLIIEFGENTYYRSKKIIDNKEIIVVSLGTNLKKNDEIDVNYHTDFYSQIRGVLKIKVDSKKMELFYMNQNQTIDRLVFNK